MATLTLDQVKAKLFPDRSVPVAQRVADLDQWASKTDPERDSLTFWTPGYRGPTRILHNSHTAESLARKTGDACSLCGAELGPRRSAMDWRAMSRQESNAAMAALDQAWAAHLCHQVACNPRAFGIQEVA